MPYFKNKKNGKLTVFINNAVPVVFQDGETKELTCTNLHEVYPRWISLIPENKLLKNQPEVEEVEVKEVISEVKQPKAGKELIEEPVAEEIKVKSKKPEKKKKALPNKKKQKISEGYNQYKKETVVAKSETFSKEKE